MNIVATASLTVEEIKTAIKYWLRTTRHVEVAGDIYFRIEGQEDPDDWQARQDLTYVLTAANFTVKR